MNRSGFSKQRSTIISVVERSYEAPAVYLWRWVYLNSIGSYQTRYEGILPPAKPGQLPRICISQAVLPAENPTEDEIKRALAEYGFAKIC